MNIQLMIITLMSFAFGSFVQRISGFGQGVVAVMILPYFWGSHGDVAAMSNVLALINTIGMSYKFRKDIQWKVAFPAMVGNLVATFFVIRFAATASFELLEKLLGLTLILLGIYFIFFNKKLTVKPTKCNGLISGCFGGTLNSLFGAGGPPVVVYFLSATSTSAIYYATTQAYFVASGFFATSLRIYNGLISSKIWIAVLFGVVGVVIGNTVGGKVVSKIPEDKFRKVVYGAMLASGVIMLF